MFHVKHWKEEHYFRYSLGRAIETIIRHLTRKEEKENENK